MNTDGSLSLTVHWDGERITDARVDSARPVDACRVLEGRTAAEAVARVPQLFSVCRRSQQAAAALACELAREGAADPASLARRELEVLSEFAIESLWRLMLDWPPMVGQAMQQREFATIRARVLRWTHEAAWHELAADLEGALAGAIYGMPLETWHALSCRQWLAESRHPTPRLVAEVLRHPCGGNAVRALPWIDTFALAAEMAAALQSSDDFAREPVWRGEPAETGPISRQRNHPKVTEVAGHAVAARIVARLVELAQAPERIRELADGGAARAVRGVACGEGTALAAVETSRGTLVHFVSLAGERVRRWRIVAPTEWNFHPRGAFVHGMVQMKAATAQAARGAGERLAAALDPCVACEVTVAHA
ncbi:MAG TPA: nickel-dependent hydrogenase large subunit [Usitatibacter sp.]|nr:nickel-dependent hydrogenase large subunit [Usitatibacter sp.]